MNIFNKSSVSGLQEANGVTVEPVITVSSEIKATVSDRVPFHTQNIEYGTDGGTLIAFIARANAEDISEANKKGFLLMFDKNIKPGTYDVTDSGFPFREAYYFEMGTIPGFTTSFHYTPQSGTFSVETIENSERKLHYKIGFNFKGKDNRNEELKIEGAATLIVFTRPM
ncbi:hypothetical protein PMI30_05722 [Pseudomonas sp. GM50]|uniref:hypothetical protein n=1 Tax=Pseudomonas sp. GM50 TaxID=1144332 RepID=UPI000270814F|nr:hypothetical protein [Pseudomonas sp. GM50]EJM59586.1 hypothetical protein PMI30_05722 [Pseudomonas sp. GM50]